MKREQLINLINITRAYYHSESHIYGVQKLNARQKEMGITEQQADIMDALVGHTKCKDLTNEQIINAYIALGYEVE